MIEIFEKLLIDVDDVKQRVLANLDKIFPHLSEFALKKVFELLLEQFLI